MFNFTKSAVSKARNVRSMVNRSNSSFSKVAGKSNGSSNFKFAATATSIAAIVAIGYYMETKKSVTVQFNESANEMIIATSGAHAEPSIIFKPEARAQFLDKDGKVDFNKVKARFEELKKKKVSLCNKYFNDKAFAWAQLLPEADQQRLLDIMLGGLANDDASCGAYATRPEDYERFSMLLEPLLREYHGIVGDIKQKHDWNIPVGEYMLTELDPKLTSVSMRARVARNVSGWNLPSSMNLYERIKFESFMENVFSKFSIPGKYYSLTPGHPNQLSEADAEQMRKDHFLFNDMTEDNHLTSSGIASDWPYGRGIWLSDDKTKMAWVGEEDHLRIISIMQGNDLGMVDKSLRDLLTSMESGGVVFAMHPVYGVITTCPTNMGTGKRQSILGMFPKLTKKGTDEANLKKEAKALGLQARGLAGEHSAMDENGTSDISPSARFGVTEAEVSKRLYNGLKALYKIEESAK